MTPFPPYRWLASRRWAAGMGVGALLLIAYIDWITGPNISVAFFYLIPLCILTWFFGKPAGYLVALVYMAIWFGIDLNYTLEPSDPRLYWNAAVRCGTFVVVSYLVGICQNLMVQIEKLIESRTQALREELRVRQQAEEAIHRLVSQLSAAEDDQRRHIAQEIH
ncbi:MAG: hypothetical protein WCI73_02260, partial [Phycisphaerae bacterium]